MSRRVSRSILETEPVNSSSPSPPEAGDAALHVVGHEGIDDAVDPQLDDLGRGGLRERAMGSERHARRRQAGEHRCASEDHHVTTFIIAPARTDGALPCPA